MEFDYLFVCVGMGLDQMFRCELMTLIKRYFLHQNFAVILFYDRPKRPATAVSEVHRIYSLRRNFLQKMALDDSFFFSCMEILAALNRNSLIPKWYWQQVYIVSR